MDAIIYEQDEQTGRIDLSDRTLSTMATTSIFEQRYRKWSAGT